MHYKTRGTKDWPTLQRLLASLSNLEFYYPPKEKNIYIDVYNKDPISHNSFPNQEQKLLNLPKKNRKLTNKKISFLFYFFFSGEGFFYFFLRLPSAG